MASYKLSPNAETDLERIWFYGLETWGVEAADHYILDIYQKFAEISEQPRLFQAVDEIREGYRRCVFGGDAIFYRIDDQENIEIMAILGQQDLENWL